MQIFQCSCPTHPTLFFESITCTICGRLTGFSDHLRKVVAFEPIEGEQNYRCVEDQNALYQRCQNNADYSVCNGMVRQNDNSGQSSDPAYCFACHFNDAIPNLDIEGHLALWHKLETAKRRTLYTLVGLNLAVPDRNDDATSGLSFSFLADKSAADHFDTPLAEHNPVFTGHDNGEITINLAEADDVARARTRIAMGEQYRTLLGHFRHETGHFYWDLLVQSNNSWLKQCRQVFGDEREDYQAAVERHYEQCSPENWRENYISAYATMHPWEDWAETWAHYLHMLDTLETAQSFGLNVSPDKHTGASTLVTDLQLPQEINYCGEQASMEDILQTWMKFSVMLNSLNRSMGLPDAYPFVLYPPIQQKLKLIHSIVHNDLSGSC